MIPRTTRIVVPQSPPLNNDPGGATHWTAMLIDTSLHYPVTKAVPESAPPSVARMGRVRRWFLRHFRPDRYLELLRADTARYQRIIDSMDGMI